MSKEQPLNTEAILGAIELVKEYLTRKKEEGKPSLAQANSLRECARDLERASSSIAQILERTMDDIEKAHDDLEEVVEHVVQELIALAKAGEDK